MAKQLTDDELNLKRKARRRLIGAIALVLAVVVILPMVLDSEPKPTGQDIELRIPAPDKVGEFVPGRVVEEVAPLPISAAVPAPAQPAVAQADAATSGKEPVAADNSRVVAPDQVKPATVIQPEPKAESKPAATESYIVQVGAYSNHNTAKQEVDKLKKWGFKVYAEKSGDMVRVRVGPYTEREKADKVRQLLEKHNVHSVLMSVQ